MMEPEFPLVLPDSISSSIHPFIRFLSTWQCVRHSSGEEGSSGGATPSRERMLITTVHQFRQMVCCSRRRLTEAGSAEGRVGGEGAPSEGGGSRPVWAIRTAVRGQEEGGLGIGKASLAGAHMRQLMGLPKPEACIEPRPSPGAA